MIEVRRETPKQFPTAKYAVGSAISYVCSYFCFGGPIGWVTLLIVDATHVSGKPGFY